MSFTDLQCVAPTIVAAISAAAIGGLAGGRLVKHGLAQVEVVSTRNAHRLGRLTCGLAGPVAILAAKNAGSWWLVPALLIWAYGLGTLATCDALAQRIPTPFVRLAAVVVGVLVTGASAASGQWHWVATAGLCAVAAGVVFTACWRFLGMGFGDVRIAVLGGVGVVDPTHVAVIAGVVAFSAITLSQAGVTLARGGTRDTMIPYGPAIAIAFVMIAVV